MLPLVRVAGAILLLGIAAFCVFGFVAASEAPADAVTAVRLVYGVIGLVAVGAASWLVWPRPAAPE